MQDSQRANSRLSRARSVALREFMTTSSPRTSW